MLSTKEKPYAFLKHIFIFLNHSPDLSLQWLPFLFLKQQTLLASNISKDLARQEVVWLWPETDILCWMFYGLQQSHGTDHARLLLPSSHLPSPRLGTVPGQQRQGITHLILLLLNRLNRSKLTCFPDEVQCTAEQGTGCLFQHLLSSSAARLFLQRFYKPKALPLPLLPRWHTPCEFIPGLTSFWQKIFTPKHEKYLTCLVSKHLRAHLQGRWACTVSYCSKEQLHIRKSPGTAENFSLFQPPLTSQNFRHDYG